MDVTNEFKGARGELTESRQRAIRAVKLLRSGMRAPQVAETMRLSVRQVYRYWRRYLGRSVWGKRQENDIAAGMSA